MNLLEQFIAVYEPQGDKSIGFRQMLEQVIQQKKPVHEVIGMRDYFAAKAMQAMANDALGQDNDKLWEEELKLLTEMSYSVADAMMKARNDS